MDRREQDAGPIRAERMLYCAPEQQLLAYRDDGGYAYDMPNGTLPEQQMVDSSVIHDFLGRNPGHRKIDQKHHGRKAEAPRPKIGSRLYGKQLKGISSLKQYPNDSDNEGKSLGEVQIDQQHTVRQLIGSGLFQFRRTEFEFFHLLPACRLI